MKKRNSRAEVILDEDDVFLLFTLPPLPSFEELGNVKKKMNISHSSLLIHLNRLISHRLINFGRSSDNHRFKVIHLTKAGERMRKELINSPDVLSRLEKLKVKQIFSK